MYSKVFFEGYASEKVVYRESEDYDEEQEDE